MNSTRQESSNRIGNCRPGDRKAQYSNCPASRHRHTILARNASLLWPPAFSCILWQNPSPVLPFQPRYILHITQLYPCTTTVPLELYSFPSISQMRPSIHSFTPATLLPRHPRAAPTSPTSAAHRYFPQGGPTALWRPLRHLPSQHHCCRRRPRRPCRDSHARAHRTPHHPAQVRLRTRRCRHRHPSLPQYDMDPTLLGLGPALAAVAVEPTVIVFRRSDTGCARRAHMLGRMAQDHGLPSTTSTARTTTPCSSVSCVAPGMRIRLSATVHNVRPDPALPGGPSVTLASIEVLQASRSCSYLPS